MNNKEEAISESLKHTFNRNMRKRFQNNPRNLIKKRKIRRRKAKPSGAKKQTR